MLVSELESNLKKVKFVVIDSTDFENFKIGGTLSFDKNLIKIFNPDEIALVGYVPDDLPVGKWFLRKFEKKFFLYFGLCTISEVKKTVLPDRLFSFLRLRKYLPIIYNTLLSNKNILSQSPHLVFTLKNYRWDNFCFYFAGLGNSIALSKYSFIRPLGGIYEHLLFKYLKIHSTIVLAAADDNQIKEKKEKYNWKNKNIIKFPTRFDDKVFYPMEKIFARQQLKLELNCKILISSGRLSYIKGWKFIVDSFIIFLEKYLDSKLLFVGDGEDRGKIESYLKMNGLSEKVILVGNISQKLLNIYLNAADIFVMGSLIEGWPTAMVEALACGKIIVTTNISGAMDMVENGKNGFIVDERDPLKFGGKLIDAIQLTDGNQISTEKSKKYSLSNLKIDLLKIFNYDN